MLKVHYALLFYLKTSTKCSQIIKKREGIPVFYDAIYHEMSTEVNVLTS